MTREQPIKLHREVECRVFMTGFELGFTYLGGMSEAIYTPRLQKFRQLVLARRHRHWRPSVVHQFCCRGLQEAFDLADACPRIRSEASAAPSVYYQRSDPVLAHLRNRSQRPVSAYRGLQRNHAARGTHASLHVLNLSLLLFVQDRGQVGSRKFRISVAGPMDGPPLALTNTTCDGLLDKTALITALNSRHLGCVALHFYSLTAPLGPLADCSNLLFIQQLNATTEEALSRVGYCAASQVLTPLNGQIQETALNADFLIATQKAC